MAIGTGAAILGSAAIGALSSKGGSKQAGNTTTVTNSAPWATAQPFLGMNLDRANKLYENPSQYLTQGVNAQAQRAMQGNPLNQASQDLNLATMRGDYTDLNKNPAAQNAMNMARTQINGQFGGDNYGNSAHQEWLGRGLLQAASPFYESERQRQTGAMAMAPTLANQDYTDISQLQGAGNAQWDQLMRNNQITQGIGGMGGTWTQSQPYFTNPAASMFGGALGGMGLYNAMNQGGLLGGYTGMNPGGPTDAWGMTGGTF